MKKKIILVITLVAVLGAGAMWLLPHGTRAVNVNSTGQKILYYTCPMHPSVKANEPGNCPICGMHLVPVYETGKGTNPPPATALTNLSMMMPGCCAPAAGL
jgi:Cu(I)/Ag(I) efflux system membrane fusion protein